MALGVSFVHLCNIERGKATPSSALIDRFRTIFGVDLHVLAWCLFEDDADVPETMRPLPAQLAQAWRTNWRPLQRWQRDEFLDYVPVPGCGGQLRLSPEALGPDASWAVPAPSAVIASVHSLLLGFLATPASTPHWEGEAGPPSWQKRSV